MKFNFTSRNIAIAILLILTLILGIVSIIIATRLSQQTTNVEGTIDEHGCRTDKGEHWCSANNLCQGSDKPCGSTEPPPGSTTCTVQYGGGSVTIPTSSNCAGKTLHCIKQSGPANSGTCSESQDGSVDLSQGQSASVSAACGRCAQIDCTGSAGAGGTRVNGGTCTNPPPPVSLVCGDAKCKTGEVCERTAANASTYKLCSAADITAGRAPTGAASPTCNITTCSVPDVVPPPVNPPPPPPISTPLPSTAVISDDFDRILIGFMFVVLGMLAYRFNLINRAFKSLNTLTNEDTIKNTLEDRYLKNSRGSFEKKVEKDFDKEK